MHRGGHRVPAGRGPGQHLGPGPDQAGRLAVGDEARGYHAENPRLWGLQLWAPVVNLLRDPRWGRNEEGYSEDPLLTGAISTAYGSGMQGDDPDHLKAAPMLKHYLANNNEVRRDTTSSNLRPRVLNEYDEPAFKPAISADAATGVMTAYNLVNGRPATVDPTCDVVRRGPTSRCSTSPTPGRRTTSTGSQAYYATQAEADAAMIKAGLDSFTVDDTNARPDGRPRSSGAGARGCSPRRTSTRRSRQSEHPVPAG